MYTQVNISERCQNNATIIYYSLMIEKISNAGYIGRYVAQCLAKT